MCLVHFVEKVTLEIWEKINLTSVIPSHLKEEFSQPERKFSTNKPRKEQMWGEDILSEQEPFNKKKENATTK